MNDTRTSITFLLRYLRAHRRSLLLGLSAMVVTDLCQLGMPWLLGQATDHVTHVLDGTAAGALPWDIVLPFVGLALGLLGARYFWRWYLIGAARSVSAQMREDYIDHVQSLAWQDYSKLKTGDLMSRATSDITSIQRMIAFGFGVGLDICVHTVVISVLLAIIDLELFLMVLGPVLLSPLVYLVVHKRLRAASTRLQEHSATLAALAQETFAGIHVVKAYANEDVREGAFDGASRDYADTAVDVSRLSAMLGPVIRLLMGISFFIAVLLGGPRLVDGLITPGDLVKFYQYLTMLSWSLFAVGIIVGIFQQGLAAVVRLREVFELPPEPGGDARPHTGGGGITVRDLGFSHGDELRALEKVSFQVAPGERVGIVGPVGSGKSTLFSLLARLLEPPPGTIFLDGLDLTEIQPRALRRKIGFVPQEPFLFSASIAENVAFSGADPADPRVRRRLELACIDDEVFNLQQGLGTVIGEKGADLSGGQKQRLTVARALVPDADVLVLDDCFSALDAETAAQVVNNVFDHARGRTVLVASHRMAVVRHCDRILVLDQGRLVQQGSHDELMADNGPYAAMVRRQALELRE